MCMYGVLCVNTTSWFMIMYRSRAKRRVMHGVLETGDLGMIKKTKSSGQCARTLCARLSDSVSRLWVSLGVSPGLLKYLFARLF